MTTTSTTTHVNPLINATRSQNNVNWGKYYQTKLGNSVGLPDTSSPTAQPLRKQQMDLAFFSSPLAAVMALPSQLMMSGGAILSFAVLDFLAMFIYPMLPGGNGYGSTAVLFLFRAVIEVARQILWTGGTAGVI